MWLGAQHPEPPYISLGQLCAAFYFAYFLLLVPILGLIENTLSDIGTKYSSTPSNSQKIPPVLPNSLPLLYLFFTLNLGTLLFYGKTRKVLPANFGFPTL
jgi:hypothetical protein